jgi:hypothetical protein
MGTDAEWAARGREMAKVLRRWARDRRPDDAKEAAALQSEMCREHEREERAAAAAKKAAQEGEGDARPEPQ